MSSPMQACKGCARFHLPEKLAESCFKFPDAGVHRRGPKLVIVATIVHEYAPVSSAEPDSSRHHRRKYRQQEDQDNFDMKQLAGGLY